MTIKKKLQCDINREEAKTSVWSSDKIKKYECLTVEEILSSDPSRMIKQGEFTYFSFGKAFQKQIKTIENQGGMQIKSIEEHEKN